MKAFESLDRFERAVKANGYRTRDDRTEAEYEDSKRAIVRELSLIAKLTEALEECGEYFDNRADADFNSEEGFIPNKEMQLLSVVKEALAKAGRTA